MNEDRCGYMMISCGYIHITYHFMGTYGNIQGNVRQQKAAYHGNTMGILMNIESM